MEYLYWHGYRLTGSSWHCPK